MKNSHIYKIGLVPYEILSAQPEIVIESKVPVEAQSAQSSIVVKGQKGLVRLSRKNQLLTWKSFGKLKPGQHTLMINNLLSEKGSSLAPPIEIPFFVTDSVAKIPKSYYVESMIRLRFNEYDTTRLSISEKQEGPYVEIFKASERNTEKPLELAFDQKGKSVDKEKLFSQLQKGYLKKYGKMHPALFEVLEKAGPKERMEVAIWIETPDTTANQTRIKLRKEPSLEVPEEELEGREKLLEHNRNFMERLPKLIGVSTAQAKIQIDPFAPVVYAKLTAKDVKKLMSEKQVQGLFLMETEGIEDLGTSMSIANTDNVHTLGQRGAGVKVAVWEAGPNDTSKLTIQGFYDPAQNNTSEHATHTHGIVKNRERGKPLGHARSCTLYSANNYNLAALRWAVKERGCTVISQSFHRSSEPGSSALSFDDIYKDWLVLQWPYPTVLQAAGNFYEGDPDDINPPSSEYVNHKGYNSLAVGNHNDSANAMSGSSVFRNPATSHGDRELPEISANGTGVTAVGLTKSGTSMAAPAVAGITACLQGANGTLKSWPEGCRAILLAGATRNVEDQTWWTDVINNVDASDGTGAVNALESLRITQNRRSRNSAATRRGWDIGTLSNNSFQNNKLSNFSYRVKIPSGNFGPRKVKVALAWNSKVNTFMGIMPTSSNLNVDMDLKIYDSNGRQVGYSGSWDNSYEIAEFTGTPGQTYTIRIRRWSGTENTWYGIAWTVTGGLIIEGIFEGMNEVIRERLFGTGMRLTGGISLE